MLVDFPVLVFLINVVKTSSQCYLPWSIEAIESCVGDDGTSSDKLLRSNSPTYFPASCIEKLSTTEDGKSFGVVLTEISKVQMSTAIEGKEVVYLITNDYYLWMSI
jgi:hypothetical protein